MGLLMMQYYYPAVFITISVFLFVLVDKTYMSKIRGIFLRAAIVLLILTISDAIDMMKSYESTLNITRLIAAALGYSLRSFIIYFIILVAERKRKKKMI